MLGKVFAATMLSASPTLAEPPPAGFQFYCLTNDCRPSGASFVSYTAQLLSDLRRVTVSVNRSIRYRPDAAEKWSVNVSSGDCEDFALTKRYRLTQMGYPSSALRLAVGHTKDGTYHAVLVVRTSSGELVLDNLTDSVLPIDQSMVRLRKMASADPMVWVSRR